MYIFTMGTKSFLILIEISICLAIRLGPFGIIYENKLAHHSISPITSVSVSKYHSQTTSADTFFQKSFPTQSTTPFWSTTPTLPVEQHNLNSISLSDFSSDYRRSKIGVWEFLKDNLLSIFFLILFMPSSFYYCLKSWRFLALRFKYKRFKFVQRTKAERSAAQARDTVIEMDPLGQAK